MKTKHRFVSLLLTLVLCLTLLLTMEAMAAGESNSSASAPTGVAELSLPFKLNIPYSGTFNLEYSQKWTYLYIYDEDGTTRYATASGPTNYSVNTSGSAVTPTPGSTNGKSGWQQVSGAWYYFGEDGTLRTGWIVYNGNYYYISPSTGALQVGWIVYGGKYYYFDPTTGALKTGWLNYGGNWYYLSPTTGNPVTGTQTIGGKTYKFNSKGVCIG